MPFYYSFHPPNSHGKNQGYDITAILTAASLRPSRMPISAKVKPAEKRKRKKLLVRIRQLCQQVSKSLYIFAFFDNRQQFGSDDGGSSSSAVGCCRK
jgi:hypothetical protein